MGRYLCGVALPIVEREWKGWGGICCPFEKGGKGGGPTAFPSTSLSKGGWRPNPTIPFWEPTHTPAHHLPHPLPRRETGRGHGRRSLPDIDTPFPLPSRNGKQWECHMSPLPFFFLFYQTIALSSGESSNGRGTPNGNPATHPPSHFLPAPFHEGKWSTIPARHLTHPSPPFQKAKCKGCVTCPHLRVRPDSCGQSGAFRGPGPPYLFKQA